MGHNGETYRIINVGKDRINRLNDRFAKYLLTGPRSKEILIDFINDALLFDNEDKIVDLEVVSGELAPDTRNMKLSVLDVAVKLADGRTIDVELQIVNRHDFHKRAPFYWAMRHVNKLKSGMTFVEIQPTISICLLAFDLLEDEEDYRNSYSIRNDKSGNLLCADMQIVYLELPKFLRYLGAAHPKTGLERWLLYFCNEEGERMEKAIAEDSVLSMAKDMELSFWADEKEREYYFQQQRLLLDAYSDEHTWEVLLKQEKEKTLKEKEKALKEKEKALKERDREVARSLLAIGGMDVDKIAQVSGLSEGEIRKLHK